MLKLQNHLRLDKQAVKAPNLCDKFGREDLRAIGTWVFDGFHADKLSRARWERRTEAALDLAMQLQKDKSFPWPNCSNIQFPLVTIGAMQFHARAYPTIVSGTDIVKMRVTGMDDEGLEHKKALRISSHMSYQVLEEDTAWEEQHDRLLLILAIVGCVFVKTYYDAELMHNVSELVMAKDMYLDYWAKSVDACTRKTHRVPLFRNDIRKRVLSGIYTDVMEEGWYQQAARPEVTIQQNRSDARKGQQSEYMPDETTPFYGLEQHCSLDLDGDGFAEPYIITVEESSQCVLRIVSRVGRIEDFSRVADGPYKDEILSVKAEEYFTKYSFIPSPDGGIYDYGFGVLLGPLNESVNSIINQLVDAGTMSNTAGGFLGRGAKIRGGVYSFAPFAWNRVDATGDDLRKSVFPLPVRDPSNVLFQLLGLLVDYTNRVSGATDTMIGESPGQNTPAQTTQTMVEMGMKIYSAIFKRVWRGMKEEFKKLYLLNGAHFHSSFGDDEDNLTKNEDYLGDPNKIVPVADPNVTSETQQLQQAMTLKQMAMSTPGYNIEAVERRVLRAMKIDEASMLFPGPGKPGATPPPQDPKIQLKQMDLEYKAKELEVTKMKYAAELMEEHQLNQGKILELTAKAEMELAKAGAEDGNQKIQALNVAIGAMKHHNEGILKQVEFFLSHAENERTREHELQIERIKAGSGSAGGPKPKNNGGSMGPVAPGPSDTLPSGVVSPPADGAAGPMGGGSLQLNGGSLQGGNIQ